MEVIADCRGHSTVKTTLNLYAHAVEAMERAAADRMEAMLAVDRQTKGK